MGSWAEWAGLGVMAMVLAGGLWRRYGRDRAQAEGTHIRHPARLVAGGGLRRIS